MLEKLTKWIGFPRFKIPAADGEHVGEPAPHGLPPSAPWNVADFPASTTENFKALAYLYGSTDIEFPHLKGVSLAQWALESGWGTSNLARQHRNYAGMKWRKADAQFGNAQPYTAHDGRTEYTHFNRNLDFIRAYWNRLDGVSAYKGWRNHTATPEDFIRFVGPIWVGQGVDAQYVKRVLYIYNTRIAA
jgi:N-acetylmuramoyl-L-alanine amidase